MHQFTSLKCNAIPQVTFGVKRLDLFKYVVLDTWPPTLIHLIQYGSIERHLLVQLLDEQLTKEIAFHWELLYPYFSILPNSHSIQEEPLKILGKKIEGFYNFPVGSDAKYKKKR